MEKTNFTFFESGGEGKKSGADDGRGGKVVKEVQGDTGWEAGIGEKGGSHSGH